MIVSISGASGVGKTTAIKNLTNSSPKYKRLRSFTTRRNRQDDPPGEICCISDGEFEELAASGEFFWEVSIHGHKYGSLRSDLMDALADTDTVLLCDVAPAAIQKIEELASSTDIGQHSLRRVYLVAPPRIELSERLRARGMPPEEIEGRIRNLENEDRYEIVNGNYEVIISSRLSKNRIAAILQALSSEI